MSDTIKFRRGLEDELPARAEEGEPLFSTDTCKLFIGRGEDRPPIPIMGGGSGGSISPDLLDNYMEKRLLTMEFNQGTGELLLKYGSETLARIPSLSVVPPTPFSASFSASSTLLQKGITHTITLTWNYNKNVDVQYINGVSVPKSDRSKQVQLVDTTTYTLSATPEGESTPVTKKVTVSIVNPCYYGVVDTLNVTENIVKSLTSSLQSSKSKTATLNLENQRICYAFPGSFGSISSIKDGNGFEYINSYTSKSMLINNESYQVYVLTDPTSVTNFKQIFA